MDFLQHAAMFGQCVTVGLAHAIPWKLVAAPLALVFGGVFMGVRQAKKRK